MQRRLADPAKPGERSVAPGLASPASAPSQVRHATRPTPQQTVAALNPMSQRGGAIRSDMESMMTDYFEGGPEAQPRGREPPTADARPIRGGVAVNSRSAVSRYSVLAVGTSDDVYARGPKDPAGRMFSASDRNLLCADVQGSNCVVGSADHGLKVFDLVSLREKRNLYTKKFGHSEWVTTVAYLADGRILSGGMDSKLCLWHASALRCDDLLGHTGSISQLAVNDQGMALSAAYDRTLRLWDCNRRATLSTLSGHTNPVMCFSWEGTLVVSGDRKGGVKMWDLDTATCIGNYETQGRQIGAVGQSVSETMGHLTYVGDQGGVLTVFDIRRTGTAPVFRATLHPGGVVSFAESMATRDLIVTAGADRRILCVDTRMDFRPVHEWNDHRDFIYSLRVFGSLVVSGGGNGWVLVHDTRGDGKCLYGLGANKAAVRCLFPTPQHLVCAGDDGCAAVYDFA